MSFADIINQAQKELDSQSGGNSPKVKYPETKHKRLFYGKDQREILIQILPSADLVSAFAEPLRKIFLSAKSSSGKQINSNFTLDAAPNPGSLLEQKITQWADAGLIPNGFGGQQSPRSYYLVNCVNIVQVAPNQWAQERDQNGKLIVRTFEVPQSGFANLLRKLKDQMLNTSQTELSFMHPDKAAPIKISKPAKGQMEYPVEVYTAIPLPPLGQGWENELEDLKAQVVPTERLENGLQWVQAFVDMKEGRKPNQQDGGQGQTAPQQPVTNPYAGAPTTPTMPTQPQQPAQPNPYAAPQGQVAPNPFALPQQPEVNPYAAPTTPQQPVTPAMPTMPTQPAQPTGLVEDNMPDFANSVPTQPAQDTVPAQPAFNIPTQPTVPTQSTVPTTPEVPQQPEAPVAPSTHNVATNSNNMFDVDSMLAAEMAKMNGGQQ